MWHNENSYHGGTNSRVLQIGADIALAWAGGTLTLPSNQRAMVQRMTGEGILLVQQCFTLKALCRFGEDILIRREEEKKSNISNKNK